MEPFRDTNLFDFNTFKPNVQYANMDLTVLQKNHMHEDFQRFLESNPEQLEACLQANVVFYTPLFQYVFPQLRTRKSTLVQNMDDSLSGLWDRDLLHPKPVIPKTKESAYYSICDNFIPGDLDDWVPVDLFFASLSPAAIPYPALTKLNSGDVLSVTQKGFRNKVNDIRITSFSLKESKKEKALSKARPDQNLYMNWNIQPSSAITETVGCVFMPPLKCKLFVSNRELYCYVSKHALKYWTSTKGPDMGMQEKVDTLHGENHSVYGFK